MSISEDAREVIVRRLDPNRVKQRPGRGSTKFDYIPTDYAIDLLNEAFNYDWDTRIITHTQVDSTVIVQLELKVPSGQEGHQICKQQYGSCDINKGVGVGDAFKGAASDALKKCATLLGVAIELYQDDTTAPPTFNAPSAPVAPKRDTPASAPPPPPRSMPMPASAPPPPPPRPLPVAPAAPVAPARPAPAPRPLPNTAAVPAPAMPTPSPAPSPAARPNPFEAGANSTAGPNPTQLNALTNLAEKKGLSQPDMIAKAVILDPTNNPKLTFDELTHSEAIQVIRAAQQ